MSTRSVALTFDVEEFDVPNEFGFPISLAEQVEFSRLGTIVILDLLAELNVKATFFITARFAQLAPKVVERIVADGHELASHSYYHGKFDDEDLLLSKEELEKISGATITGFRMPRMMPVSLEKLTRAGYKYDSSVNPTWIPGRYNKLSHTRRMYKTQGLIEIPASVSPLIRFPLFWISLHVLPMWIFMVLCRRTLNHDGYINLYLHPWEFIDLNDSRFKLPWYMTRNSGQPLVQRLRQIILIFKGLKVDFTTLNSLAEKCR